MKGLVVGVYEKKEKDKATYVLSNFADKVDQLSNGRLKKLIDILGPIKLGKTRTYFDLLPEYAAVVAVGVGPVDAGFNELEDLYENKENIRKAVSAGIESIRSLDNEIDTIDVDGLLDPESVAESSYLSLYSFDELKSESSRKKPLKFNLIDGTSDERIASWNRGKVLAEYQNKCRRLMEMPANLMTPTKFGEYAKELCEPLGITIQVHDRAWAESKKMGSFLSVANGSDQPPKFVEIQYNNAPDGTKPLVFVGKGITFDSGGISLKPASNMDAMRADMGGAANVLTTLACLAELKAKVNVVGLIPLTENMPSGKATKPGDVVYAMNGKSIQINNTDAEGRLILADALCYADEFQPQLVVDIATLTGAIVVALGQAASAVYSTNEKTWQLIRQAGFETGDRVWRMPLYSNYSKQTKDAAYTDMLNISKEPSYGGGSCIAAAFLREFTTAPIWMHIDMAGTMSNSGELSYMSKGMSGRPMRTLVNFFQKYFSQ